MDVDEAITSLVEKSLVERAGGRYRMLETPRQFADERLEESGDAVPARDTHIAVYADLSVQARVGLLRQAASPPGHLRHVS